MRLRLTLTVLTSTLICLSAFGQLDSTVQQNNANKYASQSSGLKLKPRLGLGVGTLVFYGDIGNDNAGYHPGSADLAYTLDVTNELTSYLDLRLYTIFGKIRINETTNPRYFNMQTEVRSGGMLLSYNFDHFLPASRGAEPFVSVGFESFEFLSKTDLYAANGMRYHYWSDGTIRNMEEASSNADESILLQRDHVYETDLRELNRDGFGAYPERSFAIPVGAGVQFKATERFRFRLAATYHFTLTDMVDNLTEKSAGVRQGDSRNDRFLFSSFSINYDLNPLNVKKPIYDPALFDKDGQYLANLEDTDKDGVPDLADKCNGTPEGVSVDTFGCPVDNDGDGYPDYRDQEPNSPHTYVNGLGIAMDDAEIYDHYLMWQDSIPWNSDALFSEDFAQVSSDFTKARQTYRVRIPLSDAEMTQEEINSLLSISDVEIVEQNGEKYYVVGNYAEVPEALKRKIQLGEEGYATADVVGGSNEEGYDAVAISPEMEAEAREEYYDTLEEFDSEEIHFRVQVGAYRYKLSTNIFSSMGDVMSIRGGDGLARYVSRSYQSLEEAAARRVELLLLGFDGAFITAYRGGGRITLAEAGAGLREGSTDLIVDEENNSIDPEAVNFRVQVGVFEGDIPTEELDKMLALGNVRPRREADGKTYFLSKPVQSLKEAQETLKAAKELGISTANIIGDFNGTIIPLEDALNIKGINDRQVLIED